MWEMAERGSATRLAEKVYSVILILHRNQEMEAIEERRSSERGGRDGLNVRG